MRKIYRRLIAGVFAALMLVTLFPFQAFAVDPVSAVTMANALAQALTAYGASHGVSMMFDVSDTSGIGEGLHDLWGQFKSDINDNDVPTYDSLAVTLWANLYTKVRNSVAINVSAENVGYFDQFWNWLLSGPAEMTKVDNQYYEWVLTQNNTVEPIAVYLTSNTTLEGVEVAYKSLPETFYLVGNGNRTVSSYSNYPPDYYTMYVNSGDSTNPYYFIVFSPGSMTLEVTNPSGKPNLTSTNGTWKWYGVGVFYSRDHSVSPYNNISAEEALQFVSSLTSNSTVQTETTDISVKPYIGDTTPQNVPIPDTDDPDYSPLPYVGPLGVPWIDNNFGDGETMTDAQREAIAGALDGEIEDDGTLTLEEDQTVPDNPSGEVIGGPSAYTVPGLADVFPFCIPFDIYHFLQALAADPTPPHFTAQLAFPEAIGGTQEIDIDFDSPTWNQLAQLLRLLELLLFIIGLAFVTRSMFIRG